MTASRTLPVHVVDGPAKHVRYHVTFYRTIQGQRFRFAVTDEIDGFGQAVTHVESGMKVCALGVGAAFLPAYAKLRGNAFKERAQMALDELTTRHGEARIRSVIAGAPKLRGVAA